MKRIVPFTHHNMWYVLPMISVMYEPNCYLSIDIAWIRWGIGIVIMDK